MAKTTKHYSVNWIDGMKINKDHFIAMENAMTCQQQTVSKLLSNPFSFGVLPGTNGESPLDISLGIDSGNNVNVRINRCRALTSGGLLIDIDNSPAELQEFEVSLKDQDFQSAESSTGQFYIILKTNPYKRIPFGIASPDENPPRHPFVMPEYEVYIVPSGQMNRNGFGDFFLVIGKILTRNNIPCPDKDYITPCASVSADERLLALENRINNFFGKLESDLFLVIRKIHVKQQKTPLVNTVLYLADRLVSFLGMHTTGQRLYLRYLPPVSLFEAVVRFACFLKNTLNTQPPENKEELINYFSDWCNLKQGELEKLIVDTTSLRYDHYEISAVFERIMNFADTISALFGTLATLDYIGKHKDTQIYIKEEVKQKKSFLAED
jgi:hypothetical protein